jgi:Tfp pilus assembly protein PilF
VRHPVFPVLFLVLILIFPCNSYSKDNAGNKSSKGKKASKSNTERTLVEKGSPASLTQTALLLREGSFASSEQGKSLIAAASILVKVVYPDLSLSFPNITGTHSYERIIRDIEKGVYTPPPAASQDFLECILPFLALYNTGNTNGKIDTAQYQNAIPHLERASRLNADSALPPLFLGLAYEKTGNGAEASYRKALEADNSCYPAELGLLRLLHAQGKYDEEVTLLKNLQIRYPSSMDIQKQLARGYAARQNWQEADALIAEILKQDSRNGEFILLRAHILLERGLFQQAQSLLDSYASIDPNNRRYLFYRARLQAEGLRNTAAAINTLRPLYRSDPNDAEAGVYLAALLMESNRQAEVEEGRVMLGRFLESSSTAPEALSLAAADSIRQLKWQEAKAYLDKIPGSQRTRKDLYNAWKVERALGNNTAALSHARELYNRKDTTAEEAAAYITSLVDTGRQAEAGRIIEERLGSLSGGTEKSRYYYLRSRIRTNEDAVLNDLRSALFEDPRNLEALIAIFEIYHRKKDERRAVYYLRQALAIDPNSAQLRRYKNEYGSLLGN